LALDGKGNIFEINAAAGTIGEFTASGAPVNTALISGLASPYGIALDGKGDLFVGSRFGGTVGKYTTGGTALNPSLIYAASTGLTEDGLGHLFIASQPSPFFASSDVGEYNQDGTVVNASLISGLGDVENLVVIVPEPSSVCLTIFAFSVFGVVKALVRLGFSSGNKGVHRNLSVGGRLE